MIVTVQRLYANAEETIGVLYIDGVFHCYTLEDEQRTKKVYGETRIPAGDYDCELRVEGSHHARYSKKFPGFHRGMIHLLHVPNFKWILYHIGNTDDDTAGCILCGEYPMPYIGLGKRWKLVNSTIAYKETYPIIANRLLNKDTVVWQIRE